MGTTVKKRNRGRQTSGSPGSFITPQRKREILGLIMMAFSFLVTLAVITYSPQDDPLARRFSLDALLAPGDASALNALGLTGAAIARMLVPTFLGYCVLLLPFSIFGWGYVWLRNRSSRYLRLVTSLMTLSALLTAAIFGWFSVILETDLLVWSGAWGLGLAGWMVQIVGTPGSVIILALVLLVAGAGMFAYDAWLGLRYWD
ncbi:MAG: DNA translocase FtsK 4TM domain-containing protein, partial [Bacteroidetes bacterium]|nr:DNA translocase FtsK 4TM domain-containing protein [Bacteroidota bacterium]